MSVLLVLAVLAVGLAVGVMSAMFGVGGGPVMVPFLVLVLEQTQHVAEGTSLLVIVPTAAAGAFVHRKRGYVDLPMAARLAVTGVCGAVLGALVALSLSAVTLENAFGIFTVVVGLKIFFDGLRGERPTGAQPHS
jgi:uncharacterized membrane protein YfcA